MATVQQVQEYIRDSVNWDKFFSMIATLGNSMNAPKDRFDKSDLIEMALAQFSGGNIEYVNEEGVDHRLVNLPNAAGEPTTVEMKYETNLFYKMRVVERANKKMGIPAVKALQPYQGDITLKLLNSLGSNTHSSLPAGYAEFLLGVDITSAAVVATSEITPYLNFNGDGIELKYFPASQFHKVVTPEDIKNKKIIEDFNYKANKIKFQLEFLERFN